MRTGQIEHWVEIPIVIDYTLEPAERITRTYPGCEAHIIIDQVSLPTDEEMGKILDNENDAIEMACWEDVEK